MIPRPIIYLVLAGLLIGGAAAYRDHVYGLGVTAERVRRDDLDHRRSLAADAERDALNGRIRAAQADLNIARANLGRKDLELQHAQEISNQRAADLAAGRARERVLVRAASQRPVDPDRPTIRATAADLDPDAPIEADLDPRVAGWLEGVRADHNAAIERLDACVQSYDAVKAAADAMP